MHRKQERPRWVDAYTGEPLGCYATPAEICKTQTHGVWDDERAGFGNKEGKSVSHQEVREHTSPALAALQRH